MQRSKRALLLGAGAALVAGAAQAETAPLRAVYLNGNPVQASPDPKTGQPRGPAVDVAKTLAKQLHRTLELTPGAGPDGVLSAVREGRADIGFVAYDPRRAEGLAFSPPYLMSLNTYAVRADGPLKAVADVDVAGVRIGANPTDTGGLYLKRTLTTATLTPIASPEGGRDMLAAGEIDALALNGQRLADLVGKDTRFRILPGYFYAVPQAIAMRADDEALRNSVTRIVNTLLRNGFITRSIAGAGLVGVQAANETGGK